MFDLHPASSSPGQVVAAIVLVTSGVQVDAFTLPFITASSSATSATPVTVVGLVALMNVVNFSDGVDGLAAGVCAISASRSRSSRSTWTATRPGILAAITAGAALGFLLYNFHPASVFMGDCGSNLLGLLLGRDRRGRGQDARVARARRPARRPRRAVSGHGLRGPQAAEVPALAVYRGDANHFHHRFYRIGFSQRRTVLYLYAWTLLMAGDAIALRFIPYSENSGELTPAGRC